MPFLRCVDTAHVFPSGVILQTHRPAYTSSDGATWGEALCNLVLALAEAGRLR
jgi:hypothetical protein